MRILQVIPAVAPRYGGPSQAVVQMSRALGDAGVEVMIATTNADGPRQLVVELGKPTSHEGIETIFFPIRFSERFTYSPQLAAWLKQNVGSFDVVHIHAIFSHPSLAAAAACQQLDVPYVVRPLGSLDPWSLTQKSWRKKALMEVAVKRMLRSAVAIHYTANQEKDAAETSLGLTNGVVIPLGIDLPSPQGAVSDGNGSPFILVLSRLHPKKNLESLIEAFSLVLADQKFSDWRLVIAGDGDSSYVTRLKELSARSGVHSQISFTGWVDGVERQNLLRGAQLLALPSLQENFGLCVAEALAHAVPVIISDRVNIASDVRAAGAGWLTGIEPAGIASALQTAMNDPAERERRGLAGRESITTHFSWPKVATELIDLYKRSTKTHEMSPKSFRAVSC